MTTQVIRNHLEAILAFLEPHRSFVNCHMVNYLTDKLWDTFIPKGIKDSIGDDDGSIGKIIESVFWNGSEEIQRQSSCEPLSSFLEKTAQHRLDRLGDVIINKDDLLQKLGKVDNSANISIVEFMSEKKRHEVEITAELISNLIDLKTKSDFYVIDAGDGKGYLSSRLALQYGLRVLGIDANEANSENALERNRKLEKAWYGLTLRADLISKGIKPTRRGKKAAKETLEQKPEKPLSSDIYKTTSRFITTELDFGDTMRKFFEIPNETDAKICLTGLHTCGNLASTCLKAFTASKDLQILCNIGCCYHLINEEFSQEEFYGNKAIVSKNIDSGFPMSEYLRAKGFKLGRNARMLAAQSIHRTIDSKELPNKTLFYRALLEVLIVGMDASLKDTVQVGKIKKCTTFTEYVEKCDKKLNLGLFEKYSMEDISNFELRYSKDAKFLDLFYLIRMSLAPVLETIILLDRLLYLKENTLHDSFLIPLFDPVVSPRCYCIVALK